jgi:hypothetical protein
MIANDQQLITTLERIDCFQKQVANLRRTEINPANYRAAVSGFLTEIHRMQVEVREYFSFLPAENTGEAALLAEAALAVDWSRPEEDAAWSHLQ